VHGQLIDTDNPKTCTLFGHEQKTNLYFGYYIKDTRISYTYLLRKQSVSVLRTSFDHSVLNHAISHRHYSANYDRARLIRKQGNLQTDNQLYCISLKDAKCVKNFNPCKPERKGHLERPRRRYVKG